MPKQKFELSIDGWREVHEFPDSWPISKLREVLALLEYEAEVSDEELAEVVLMLLEDRGPRLGAEVVLEAVFGDQMSAGVRQNIAVDLQEDEPWAQHATVAQQAGIFAAVVLLQRAMPKFFDLPEAVQFNLRVHSSVPEARAWLNDHVNAGLVVRLLSQGMETQATLNRLYKDELNGDSFPAANDILWCVSKIDADRYSIISSRHWMASLEDRINWTARAIPDRASSQ
jgi:hypothetical protein